jgi:predicted dehydrogenase
VRKAVVVEKPFTINAGEARELVATARAKQLFLMEAMWTRFLPHIREIRRLLDEDVLGTIVAVHADHGGRCPSDPTHRIYAPALGGGALLDLGVYTVPFASMVLGRPQRIAAVAGSAPSGVDAQVSMAFGYENGAQALLHCTLLADLPNRATIIGTDGRIEVDGPFFAPTSFTVVPRRGEPTRHEQAHHSRGMRHEAEEVGRCLRAGLHESPLMPLDETVEIMETLDAVIGCALRTIQSS